MIVGNLRRWVMSAGSGPSLAGEQAAVAQRPLRRSGTTALIAGLTLALFVAPLRLSAQETTPTTDRFAEQRVVDIEDGEPVALSPDGRRLAVLRREPRELCAYDTATLEPGGCAPFTGRSIQNETAVWSPDGSRLAFTENVLLRLDESDLWVFDPAAGTITNLTDDGADLDLLRSMSEALIDTAPTWSPDGTELVFARSVEEADDVYSTTLYRIPAAGGEPVEVARVADERLVVGVGVTWSPDGESILYTVAYPYPDPANGLWSVPAAGGKPEQILAAEDAGAAQVYLVDAAGERALLVSSTAGGVAFSLLDLATGQAALVESIEAGGRNPSAAALSPDGDRLLVAYGDRLALRDLASGSEQPLGSLDLPVGSPGLSSGLTWAENGLVFGVGPARRGLLLDVSAVG